MMSMDPLSDIIKTDYSGLISVLRDLLARVNGQAERITVLENSLLYVNSASHSTYPVVCELTVCLPISILHAFISLPYLITIDCISTERRIIKLRHWPR